MRTSINIAATSSIALTTSMLLVLLLTKNSDVLALDLVAPIAGGFLVGLGSYIGSRWAPPDQRSDRFAWALAAFYFGLGVLLTIPNETHAVKIDTPLHESTYSAVELASNCLAAAIASLIVIGVAIIFARAIAFICRPRPRHA